MSSFFLAWIVLISLVSSLVLGMMYLYSIRVKKIPDFIFTTLALFAPMASFVLGVLFFIGLSKGVSEYI